MRIFFSVLTLLTVLSVSAQKFNIQIRNAADHSRLNIIGKPVVVDFMPAGGGAVSRLSATSTGDVTAPGPGTVVLKNPSNNTVLSSLELKSSMDHDHLFIDVNDQFSNGMIYAMAAASSKGYWLGAKIGYNLNGASTSDIIGGTKLVINPSTIFQNDIRNSLAVIGNVGTFFSDVDNKDNQSAIGKLIQSESGLGIGLGYIRELNKKSSAAVIHRLEISTGYRLNSFKVPGDSAALGLNQWRSGLLYEVELDAFKNKGRLTIDFEGSVSAFNKHTYQNIFNENKGMRASFETTIIVPLAENIGFMANLLASKGISPLYQFGIAIRTPQSN